MIKTQIGRLGMRVALGATIAIAPAAAVAGVASAANSPAPAVASANAYHATDGWYYWHCVRNREFWRPACQGPGPAYPPPPPTGSLGAFLEIG